MSGLGYSHTCVNYGRAGTVHCEKGAGKAPRAKCRGCGSGFVNYYGHWTVQEWRGDGRYTLDGAVSVWASERAAERHVVDPSHVVRFIAGGVDS